MRQKLLEIASVSLAVLSGAVCASAASPKAPEVDVQTAITLSGSSAQETNGGNLVADAVRGAGQADIGLVAADELTDASIPVGMVPVAKLSGLLHYSEDATDTVVVLKLTGAAILHALELGLGHAPRPFPGFWQVSGVQVRYDASQPEGRRVSLAGIGGSEINAGKTYSVATTRPVALGNLGYYRVWDKKDIVRDTGISIVQCLASYAQSQHSLHSKVEGRIVSAH